MCELHARLADDPFWVVWDQRATDLSGELICRTDDASPIWMVVVADEIAARLQQSPINASVVQHGIVIMGGVDVDQAGADAKPFQDDCGSRRCLRQGNNPALMPGANHVGKKLVIQ